MSVPFIASLKFDVGTKVMREMLPEILIVGANVICFRSLFISGGPGLLCRAVAGRIAGPTGGDRPGILSGHARLVRVGRPARQAGPSPIWHETKLATQRHIDDGRELGTHPAGPQNEPSTWD